ncbi:MAG: hypothetical protein KAQ85_04740, partial [Thermodesulfovibrionia bacterium]|nr:hypothetical protein [Thermodesulfovibrionia bacterium]
MKTKVLMHTLDKLLVATGKPNHPFKEMSQFIPSDLTVASLVKTASERKTTLSIPRLNYDTTHCIFTQVDPEFTTVVERSQGKFNAGMFQVLSQFLSGESYHKGTISGGDISVEDPYFNMFIGAQDHYPKILPPPVWTQGFPNRFFYVIDEYGLTNVYTGTRTDRGKFGRGYSAEKLKLIRLWLKMIQKVGGVCVFKAEKDALKLLEDFDEKIFQQQGNPQVNRYLRGYLGRLPDYATKLACMHNISKRTHERLRQDLIQSGYISYSYSVTHITVEDVKWGIKQVGFYLKQFEKLIDFLMEKSYIKAVPTREAMWMVVWSAIKDVGIKNKSGVASRTEIIRKTRISAKDLDDVLDDLIMGKYIKRDETKTKTNKKN